MTPVHPRQGEGVAEAVELLKRELADVSALREAIFKTILNEGGVMVAPGEEPDGVRRIIARAVAAEAALSSQEEELEAMAGALEPFSREAETWPDGSLENELPAGLSERPDGTAWEAKFSMADVGRARTALSTYRQTKEDTE